MFGIKYTFLQTNTFLLGWHSWDAFQWSFLFDRLSSAFSIPTYTKSLPYRTRGRRMGMRIKIRSRKEEFIKSRLVHFNIFKDRAIRLCPGTRCLFLEIQTGIINNTALRLPVQERRQHRLYIISLLQLFKLMVNE